MRINCHKKRNLFDIVLDITLFLLSILVIYWLIQLILGGSPGISEINFALIMMVAGFYVKLNREVGEIKVDNKHNFARIKDSFDRIKEDIGQIKDDLGILKGDFNILNADMNLIKNKLKI